VVGGGGYYLFSRSLNSFTNLYLIPFVLPNDSKCHQNEYYSKEKAAKWIITPSKRAIILFSLSKGKVLIN